jgi:hypothetical protein
MLPYIGLGILFIPFAVAGLLFVVSFSSMPRGAS